MAVTHSPLRDVRRPSLLWSRLHFGVRFLGLTGALAGFVGLVLIQPGAGRDCLAALNSDVPQVWLGGWLLVAGAGVAALALLVELAAILRLAAGRRNAVGANALIQIALATLLVLGLNVWSFRHALRFDWTRAQLFTLPGDLAAQLGQLDRNSETTVVVYQRHKTFGALSDKPDRFDYAAERKVVEKVKDLVSLLREVGPQLRVEVLDVEEEGFDEKLKALTQHAPALRKAIDAAPENSIFISNRGDKTPANDAGPEYVQQLSFNELYQLDKVQSRQDNGGRGNLVLLGQGRDGRGVRPFVRKIRNLEERRPRIGVLAIHPLLTTEGEEPSLTMAGLRKTLTVHGFEVTDIVTKKGWDRGGSLEPAADTFEESKLERLEAELEEAEDDVKGLGVELKLLTEEIADLTPKPGEDAARRLEELSAKYQRIFLGGKLTERAREQLLAWRKRQLTQIQEEQEAKDRERDRLREERDQLNVDRISEARRLTDVKAKLGYALADCDLLLVPRLTRRSNSEAIPARLYNLDPRQVDALKDALKAGKPMLACFGPINEPPNVRLPPNEFPPGPDGLERLLADLGIHMGSQTILTSADSKTFAERRISPLSASAAVVVPPVDLESPVEAATRPWLPPGEPLPPNRLREGLRVTAHSVGKKFDIPMRFPRPISYEAGKNRKPAFEPTFLLSSYGWNEDQPFPTAERRPRFTPPSPTDPTNGTIDARRRGQFSIGVAVETPLPEEWGKDAKDRRVRVAAIGQGEVFVGADLKPAQERLLLQTINWLLGRDDYLPQAEHPWRYPRLPLTPENPGHRLWLWGARLGLPVLFAYLGFVVLLFRRLR